MPVIATFMGLIIKMYFQQLNITRLTFMSSMPAQAVQYPSQAVGFSTVGFPSGNGESSVLELKNTETS